MRTSVPFRQARSSAGVRTGIRGSGFTLLELLVVLLIVGLLVGLAAPSAMNLVGAATRETQRREIASSIERLPVEARLSGKPLTFEGEAAWPGLPANYRVRLVKPLRVLPSGICSDASATISTGDQVVAVQISAPFCRVQFD